MSSNYTYTDGMTAEKVAEIVASLTEKVASMTDAQVFEWAGKWSEMAANNPWNALTCEKAKVYNTEMRNRMSK